MDIETRLKKIEQYCFSINNQFQTDVFESVLTKFETEGLGIGKRLSPDSAAFLMVTSPNKGIAFPQMTEAARDAIVNPMFGLVIANLDTLKLNVFTTVWEEIQSV